MNYWDGCFAIRGTLLLHHARTFTFLILLTFFPLVNALAQPMLEFLRVVNNWPTVELYYKVSCGGTTVWNLSAGDFRVSDADKEVTQFTVRCPDPTTPAPMSVALVFDASASMAGAGNAGIKQGGMQFVGQMLVGSDEASVLWFNQSVTIGQTTTKDTTLLNAAILSIPATGQTAVRDGIWDGLQEVASNGTNSTRAVVVVTDGADNSSSTSAADIIAFANTHHIRVFAIGLGTGFNASELTKITEETGGRLYQTSTVPPLGSIYTEIASIIHQGFLDCSIIYTASCADGALHTVDLSLPNFCGGSDAAEKSYLTPLDTTTFSPLNLALVDTIVQGGDDFVVPLILPLQLNGEILTTLSFDVCFNSHQIEFRGVEIPSGGLLDGIPIAVSPVTCGVRIRTIGSKSITGSGELLRMNFHAAVVPPDTLTTDIFAVNASFSEGCFTPEIDPATITVLPGTAQIFCDMYMPRSFVWNIPTASYVPSPFEAKLRLYNTGTVPSTNGSCEISIDTTVFRLISPTSARVSIPDIPASDYLDVTWQLVPLPTVTVDSSLVTITARFGNHSTIDCAIRAGFLQSEPVLAATCAAPDTLRPDTVSMGYQPNPFVVELSCQNIGTDTAYNVSGTITFPPGLTLEPPTQQLTQQLSTTALAPYVAGQPIPKLSWTLRWNKREAQDSDLTILTLVDGVTRTGAPITTAHSVCRVAVMGLRSESSCSISMPDSLTLNPAATAVVPNPVPVRYGVRNTGFADLTLARVRIYFPADGLTLNPASPNGLDEQVQVLVHPGDSTTFDWLIDVQNRSTTRDPLIQIVHVDVEGNPGTCESWLHIPAVPPGRIVCDLQAERVTANYAQQQYSPMPFRVMLNVTNNRITDSDSMSAQIELPVGELVLSGADAGVFTKSLAPVRLLPQQQGSVRWMLEHPLTSTEKRYIVRTLLWENGGDTTFCETEVVIPAMRSPFWFTLSPSGPLAFCDGGSVTLHAGSGYASYLWSTQDTTEFITVTQAGGYWCGVLAADGTPGLSDNVTVIVHPLPAKPIVTRAGDVLSTDPAAAWQWYRNSAEIQGANAQSYALLETGTYLVRIIDTNGCEALSDSHVVSVLAVDEGHAVGQRFRIYPNPADGMLNVDVTLERPAAAVITVRDLLGRELRCVSSSEPRLAFIERLDLRVLNPGVYFVQLQAGTVMQTQMVVVK
ncbi:MAG: T9SS type A sorting domain-containing protein [Bacteroidota bacterium]|jgi:hypothetical protein